jgi:hypothetical protein
MYSANDNKKSMPAQQYTQEDRQELASMARRLRRVKRQLLLKEVAPPPTPVDSFRSLITRAMQHADLNDGSDSSVSSALEETSFKEKLDCSLRTQPSRSIKGSVSFIHVVHLAPRAAWKILQDTGSWDLLHNLHGLSGTLIYDEEWSRSFHIWQVSSFGELAMFLLLQAGRMYLHIFEIHMTYLFFIFNGERIRASPNPFYIFRTLLNL